MPFKLVRLGIGSNQSFRRKFFSGSTGTGLLGSVGFWLQLFDSSVLRARKRPRDHLRSFDVDRMSTKMVPMECFDRPRPLRSSITPRMGLIQICAVADARPLRSIRYSRRAGGHSGGQAPATSPNHRRPDPGPPPTSRRRQASYCHGLPP